MDFIKGNTKVTLTTNTWIRVQGTDGGGGLHTTLVNMPTNDDYDLEDIMNAFNNDSGAQSDKVTMVIDNIDGFIRFVADPTGTYATLSSADAGDTGSSLINDNIGKIIGNSTVLSNHILKMDSFGYLLRWAFSINLFQKYYGSIVSRENISKGLSITNAFTYNRITNTPLIVRRGYKLKFILTSEWYEKFIEFLNFQRNATFSFDLVNSYAGLDTNDEYDVDINGVATVNTVIDYRDVFDFSVDFYKRVG